MSLTTFIDRAIAVHELSPGFDPQDPRTSLMMHTYTPGTQDDQKFKFILSYITNLNNELDLKL